MSTKWNDSSHLSQNLSFHYQKTNDFFSFDKDKNFISITHDYSPFYQLRQIRFRELSNILLLNISGLIVKKLI
jgi:hypothetical protein